MCGLEPLYPTGVDFQRAREKSGEGQTSFLSQRLWTNVIQTKAKSQEIKKRKSFSEQDYKYLNLFAKLAMADTAVDTTATAEVTAKELKEKKEVEAKEEEKTDNGDAPANGTNGADHSDKVEKKAEEKHKNGDGKAEEAPPAEETDAQPVKRAAEEEEEKVETKKQKTEENGDSKEAEVEA